MGKTYSQDLRDRVQAHVAAGCSRRDAARRFGVSASFAVRLAAHVLRTGTTAPVAQGRPAGGGKLALVMGFLIARVEAQPDITMPELAAALEEAHGVTAHPASLSRALCAAGFSYKKIADGRGVRTRQRQAGAAGMDEPAPAADAPGASQARLHR
jgi:transposase